MGDRFKPISIFLIIAMVVLATVGCGNKGPLYIPKAKPIMEQPVEPKADTVEQQPLTSIQDTAVTEN